MDTRFLHGHRFGKKLTRAMDNGRVDIVVIYGLSYFTLPVLYLRA
jgi:hypothetical protein